VTEKPPSETTDADLMVMGKITGAHGLEGNIRVRSFAESDDMFAPGCRLFIKTENTNDARPYVIEKCARQKKGLLIRLSGVNNRDQADELMGKEILVLRSGLPEPEDNAWYWQDLYGLTVTDASLGEIGTIETIFSTGAHDILVVKDNTRETLIPMHRQFVTGVDLENAVVYTRLPKGYE
jgi:16S rRNA processing protein RimM